MQLNRQKQQAQLMLQPTVSVMRNNCVCACWCSTIPLRRCPCILFVYVQATCKKTLQVVEALNNCPQHLEKVHYFM